MQENQSTGKSNNIYFGRTDVNEAVLLDYCGKFVHEHEG
jgi:hypothetical protein